MPSQPEANPVLVDVVRNEVVESAHRGSVTVVNSQGEVSLSIGDPERMIYPRSALKFLQAIPLVESGAADHYGLSDREIALACASHNAEHFHTEAVIAWLNKLGLGVGDLECGPTPPIGEAAAYALIASGEKPTRVHQNCSGKHTGMLTVACYLGESLKGYSGHGHPVQQAWMKTLGELTGLDVDALHWERDGCGMPAIVMPSDKLAYGLACFTNTDDSARGQAMARIANAVARHPEMVAGTGRCCTELMQVTEGRVLAKTGAEGVYAGCIPSLGLGFTLKADDGATRGSEVMLGALLNRLEVLSEQDNQQMKRFFNPDIINSQGKRTGGIRPSAEWSSVFKIAVDDF